MDECTETRERAPGKPMPLRHYHVIENAVGDPNGYRDDLFHSRRHAVEAAKMRAHRLAAMAGSRVEPLMGPPGRYLVTTGEAHDAGRMMAVEPCDDPDCLEVEYRSMLDSGKDS
jgi:hypothetical protein